MFGDPEDGEQDDDHVAAGAPSVIQIDGVEVTIRPRYNEAKWPRSGYVYGEFSHPSELLYN